MIIIIIIMIIIVKVMKIIMKACEFCGILIYRQISGQNKINETDMSDEQLESAAAIRAKLLEENDLPTQNLRAVERNKLKEATQAVNNVLRKLDTENINAALK